VLIHDPTTHSVRPATAFAALGRSMRFEILEGMTGKPFRYDRVTGLSFPAVVGDLPLFEIEDTEPEIVMSTGSDNYEPLHEASVDEPTVLKAIFLAGAGGSGKGRVGSTMFGGTGLKIIDQDKHLERFMAAAKMPLKDVGLRYDLLKKAQRMKAAETRQYGSRRLGLVIDSTGWDYDKVAGPVRKLRNLGYDCFMVYVDTSLDTAVSRNKARADAGGRNVPLSFIRDAFVGAKSNLPKYRTLFGGSNLVIVDNNEDVSDEDWILTRAPRLRKIATKILAKPIKNPKGQEWLAQQADPSTALEPTTDDWPDDASLLKEPVEEMSSANYESPEPGPMAPLPCDTSVRLPNLWGVSEVTSDAACLVPPGVWREWADYYPAETWDNFLKVHHPGLAAKVFRQ